MQRERKPMKPKRFSAFRWRIARRWRREDGNVAMMFGLLLIPMIGAVGLAVR